ncbi:MAG: hypothetical protein VXZ82_00805 [Planctomycetota bacterium]|nr:hypothetical protein [Planctomycetota bacterium]
MQLRSGGWRGGDCHSKYQVQVTVDPRIADSGIHLIPFDGKLDQKHWGTDV